MKPVPVKQERRKGFDRRRTDRAGQIELLRLMFDRRQQFRHCRLCGAATSPCLCGLEDFGT